MEVISEINTPASFQTFAESLNTGLGIVGTTHAEDVKKLINRVVEQGLPHLLRELDLVVFRREVDGGRYVSKFEELDCELPDGSNYKWFESVRSRRFSSLLRREC